MKIHFTDAVSEATSKAGRVSPNRYFIVRSNRNFFANTKFPLDLSARVSVVPFVKISIFPAGSPVTIPPMVTSAGLTAGTFCGLPPPQLVSDVEAKKRIADRNLDMNIRGRLCLSNGCRRMAKADAYPKLSLLMTFLVVDSSTPKPLFDSPKGCRSTTLVCSTCCWNRTQRQARMNDDQPP